MSEVRGVELHWSGERLRFTGGGTEPESPAIVLDGDVAAGPSPMQALLLAAAACAGADVVAILKKMRVPLRSLSVALRGTRRDEEPRRYTGLHFQFRMEGDGLDLSKAERAVELSLEKYCSVVHSLAPDIAVSHEIEVA
jgi:putative redox protein